MYLAQFINSSTQSSDSWISLALFNVGSLSANELWMPSWHKFYTALFAYFTNFPLGIFYKFPFWHVYKLPSWHVHKFSILACSQIAHLAQWKYVMHLSHNIKSCFSSLHITIVIQVHTFHPSHYTPLWYGTNDHVFSSMHHIQNSIQHAMHD